MQRSLIDRIFGFDSYRFDMQIVFTDPRNKAIFTNSDYGKTIVRQMLDFTPSEISFYEQDARTFLVLDKADPDRKVRICCFGYGLLRAVAVATELCRHILKGCLVYGSAMVQNDSG